MARAGGSRRQSAEKLTGRARQQRRWGMSTGRRYSGWALLLLATFANLRFGELAGLRRNQIDLDACEVRVNASTSEMDDGPLIDGRSGEVNRARSRWPHLAPPVGVEAVIQ